MITACTISFAARHRVPLSYLGGYFSKIPLTDLASLLVLRAGLELSEDVDAPWKTSWFLRASTTSTVSVPRKMGWTVVVDIALPQPASQPEAETGRVGKGSENVFPVNGYVGADHKIAAGFDAFQPPGGQRLLDEPDDSFLHELVQVVAGDGPGPAIGLVVREVVL